MVCSCTIYELRVAMTAKQKGRKRDKRCDAQWYADQH